MKNYYYTYGNSVRPGVVVNIFHLGVLRYPYTIRIRIPVYGRVGEIFLNSWVRWFFTEVVFFFPLFFSQLYARNSGDWWFYSEKRNSTNCQRRLSSVSNCWIGGERIINENLLNQIFPKGFYIFIIRGPICLLTRSGREKVRDIGEKRLHIARTTVFILFEYKRLTAEATQNVHFHRILDTYYLPL